ncbi:phosphopantetheine-binding protein [Planosporangium sp. 12N6]|uniref:phosphopantetheine-binding protein n=1 Tax=Planosporangium spinosum TaxID=3402278 RepID=UPI003CF003B9
MAEPSIAARVRDLVIEAAPIAVGRADPNLALTDDLGYDSLSLLELMSLLEAEFDLPPVDGDFRAVRTVRDAEEMVRRILDAPTVP